MRVFCNFQAILDEIRHYSADIISLQEVETDQFFNFFKPELKNDGYEGIFSPKSRAKTMSESDRKYVDGCAIFFRSSKLVARSGFVERVLDVDGFGVFFLGFR